MKDYTMRKTFALLLLLAGCGATAPTPAQDITLLNSALQTVVVSAPCALSLVAAAGGTGSDLTKGVAVATATQNPACTAADQAILSTANTITVTVKPTTTP